AKPGIAIKALYLKHKHSLPFSSYTAVIITTTYLLTTISALLCLCIIVLSEFDNTRIYYILLTFVVSAITILFFAYIWHLIPSFRKHTSESPQSRLLQFFANLSYNLTAVTRNRRQIVTLLKAIIIQQLTSAIGVFFAYKTIGLDLNYGAAVLIASLSTISGLLS